MLLNVKRHQLEAKKDAEQDALISELDQLKEMNLAAVLCCAEPFG